MNISNKTDADNNYNQTRFIMNYEKESELVNVPSKTFYQGEHPDGEKPIIINYYNGTIELDQQSNLKVLIQEDQLEAFIKSLRSGFKKAQLLKGIKS